MSSTTPPPPDSSASSAAGDKDDWRSNVQQSYRNTEVREIAKILASLEPGATFASKLRLAMQFENTIFTSADSLADYRKKLARRLKKLQKSYKPVAAAESPTTEGKVAKLRQKYGETLRFIVKNAPVALQLMKEKAGEAKTQHVKLHIDNARQWAMELGVLDETKTGPPRAIKDIDKLEKLLEARVENIRSHVAKTAHPDLFLKETMSKVEQDFINSAGASKLLATCTKKQLEQMQNNEFEDPKQVLIKSFEKAQTPIPPLSRQNKNAQTQEALLHLEKMRFASQVFVAYMALEDKTNLPPKILSKCYSVVTQGTQHIMETTKNTKDNSNEAAKVTLEDAWNKVLEITHVIEVADEEESPAPKRIKRAPPCIRSRVLLTPGRKTPSNLLPELKRKHAKLVRPEPDGQGSHLVLEFGNAFSMTIYLVPLLVQIREPPSNRQDTTYTIWGVTGSRTVLGHVVAQRLRHASAQATRVLRECFASSTCGPLRSDFEVEISEATALLQFIQLARTTYTPQWRDEDGV